MGNFLFLTFNVRWLQETLRFNNTLSISNAKFHFSGNIFLVWNNILIRLVVFLPFYTIKRSSRIYINMVQSLVSIVFACSVRNWAIFHFYYYWRVYTSNNILLLKSIGLPCQTKNISGHWVQLFLCWLDVLLHFPFYVAWSAQIERYTNLTFLMRSCKTFQQSNFSMLRVF